MFPDIGHACYMFLYLIIQILSFENMMYASQRINRISFRVQVKLAKFHPVPSVSQLSYIGVGAACDKMAKFNPFHGLTSKY